MLASNQSTKLLNFLSAQGKPPELSISVDKEKPIAPSAGHPKARSEENAATRRYSLLSSYLHLQQKHWGKMLTCEPVKASRAPGFPL